MFLTGDPNNGLSVMTAPNGESCLWMFIFLQDGHVQTMSGTLEGANCIGACGGYIVSIIIGIRMEYCFHLPEEFYLCCRRICSAPDEMSPEELESLLRVSKGISRELLLLLWVNYTRLTICCTVIR